MKELVVVAMVATALSKITPASRLSIRRRGESRGRYGAGNAGFRLRHCATHGNGPQVGLDLRRAEIAHGAKGCP